MSEFKNHLFMMFVGLIFGGIGIVCCLIILAIQSIQLGM